MRQDGAAAFPDGIADHHLARSGPLDVVISWIPLLVLGALLAVALTGVLGGGRNPEVRAFSPRAVMTFNAPQVLRSGQFFEMRLTVAARSDIARPVVSIPVDYWHDLTINSFYPGPAKEESRGGQFLLELEPIKAGQSVHLKVDGQVNPPLVGKVGGRLELRDDETRLASMPVSLRVLP